MFFGLKLALGIVSRTANDRAMMSELKTSIEKQNNLLQDNLQGGAMSFLGRSAAIITFHIILITASNVAQAALVVTWEFDQPFITAQPSDRIPITATITNSATSDQTFDPFEFFSWGYSYQTGDPAYEYYYLGSRQFEYPEAGYDDLSTELGGLVLDPGKSHQFLFFVLVPSNGITGGGFVPSGTYDFGPYYFLHFDSNAGTNYDYYYIAQNGFTVTVVPVPAAIWLFASGLAGLVGITATRARTPVC